MTSKKTPRMMFFDVAKWFTWPTQKKTCPVKKSFTTSLHVPTTILESLAHWPCSDRPHNMRSPHTVEESSCKRPGNLAHASRFESMTVLLDSLPAAPSLLLSERNCEAAL
mmetsp:Transcript_11671/g.20962  ORF Transcript_11671/g.20962 Transcript_11671/m.20962 type:complete len:110 (-) Transcript_11671:539-868(-)